MEEKESLKKNKYKNLLTLLICIAAVFAGVVYIVAMNTDLETTYAYDSQEESTSLQDALSALYSEETETTLAATETTVSASASATGITSGSTSTVYTEDGTTYVVKNIDTNLTELEAGADSGNSNYVIYVNLAWNVVTVCTIDDAGEETPLKAFYCSCARDGYTTPEGEFEMGEWYEWCYLADGTYGQYSYRLSGDSSVYHILFHSVPYEEMSGDSLEWAEYDKLGESASLGCIRVCTADARWLCENVGSGSKVIIYTDESSAGPITPVSSCFIPPAVTQISGWDPTDPDSENPWLDYTFTLTSEDEITISKGTELNISDYITAVDIYGNDLSAYASYTLGSESYGFSYTGIAAEEALSTAQEDLLSISYNNVAFAGTGSYTVTVSVTAGLVTAARTITVNVVE